MYHKNYSFSNGTYISLVRQLVQLFVYIEISLNWVKGGVTVAAAKMIRLKWVGHRLHSNASLLLLLNDPSSSQNQFT